MLTLGMLPLEGGHVVNPLPIPAVFFGVIALAMLLGALSIVRAVGHGRPHSEGQSEDH